MPLYEYQCPKCGENFDKIVSFSEADKVPVCPNCGAEDTKKKISAGAFLGSASNGGNTTASRPVSSPFT